MAANKATPATAEEWASGQSSMNQVGKAAKAKQERRKSGGEVERVVANRLSRAMQLRWVDHLSFEEIARVLEVSRNTVQAWLKPFAVIMENPEEVRAFKQNEANILDGIRFLAAKGMYAKLSDEAMVKKMDLSRLTYNFGVLYDKTRLERGQSTENVMTLSDLVKAAHAKDVTPEPAPENATIVETKEV